MLTIGNRTKVGYPYGSAAALGIRRRHRPGKTWSPLAALGERWWRFMRPPGRLPHCERLASFLSQQVL